MMARDVFATRAAAVQRHLDRVAQALPKQHEDLLPSTATADTVILHLWQAVQITIDMAMSATVHLGLGTPSTYARAFQSLSEAGHLDVELAQRLARAAGFRNLVAHAYEGLDMKRVHEAARKSPADLLEFLVSGQK